MKSLIASLILCACAHAASLATLLKTPTESYSAGVEFAVFQTVATTGSASQGSSALAIASGFGTVNGQLVIGAGIAPGTVIASGGGTTSLVLSNATTAALSGQAVGFADPISIQAVTATDIITKASVSSTFISASPGPTVATAATIGGVVTQGQFVIFRVQGGNNNQRILVDVLVQDQLTGETRDGQITFTVSSGLGN